MRVTDTMRFDELTLAGSRSAEQLMRATSIASTGQKVATPSDDPAAYTRLLAQSASIAQITARKDAMTRASDDLGLADGALSSAADIMTNAKQLALQMANGTEDAASRAAAAKQIQGMASDLVGLANTQGSRGYLFAGTATQTAPFTANGTFVGNAGVVGVEVAEGTVATANASGANAFTAAGGVDVFQVLTSLSQALAGNSAAGVQATISGLDQAHAQIVAARADAGLASARLTSAASVASSTLEHLQAASAGEGQADPVKAYTALAQAQAAYQQSIQVTAQILSITANTRG